MAGYPSSESRVLFFTPTLETGGAERVCLSYINNLVRLKPVLAVQFRRGPLLTALKVDVPLYETTRTSQVPWAKTSGGFRTAAAKVVDVLHATLSRLPLLSDSIFLLSQARYLARLVQECQCQAVSSFITAPNIIAILAKMFYARDLKVIINVHDVTSRILEHSKLVRHERVLLRWLIRRLYPKADLIVAVASGIKRDLVENFGVPPEKIIVIYNPIDVSMICQRAAEPVDHPWLHDRSVPLLVAVGRLVKLKGFDLLIRAVAQLSTPARLILIGEGEERVALENLIAALGLTDQVTLLGFQENPWKYMAQADLFVLSSLTEGLPNVIGEAMALGLPILATDCSPGVREYLDDGRAGLLVPPGDPHALAQGIARLLSDGALRKELDQRSRERIAQFDLPVAVQAYENLLKSLFV